MTSQIKSGAIKNSKVIIPQAVFDELQSQAARKQEKGFTGLEKIKSLILLSGNYGLEIVVDGTHPSPDDIGLANTGRIDALIIDMAKIHNATLYTSDKLQHLVAQTQGVQTVLLRSEAKEEELEFLKFFDPQTMSIHLKENQYPMAKKGTPGAFVLEKIGDDLLSKKYLEMISSQISNLVTGTSSNTLEISKTGASVIQYNDYRIAITSPPFSDSVEITIVHPIVKLSLDDYDISEKLMKRFSDSAEGIVISGAPGSGKSTLASGLANFYHGKGNIVKTFESPRDLQVDSGITQYGKLDESFDNTADILLLVRPDYTIFDEVRRREDFITFADLRMTGVGMVGVVHANSPLDAIQRFIGKIELGMIPNVLDTVVYIKGGQIDKVYDLELTVKVPTGMTESDLARPVIEIKNFQDDVLEHEIYTFGEENVIVPVAKKVDKVGIQSLAEEKIRDVFARYDSQAQIEILSNNKVKVSVDESCIASIIGRGGSNITEIEKRLKVHLDIVPKKPSDPVLPTPAKGLPFTISETKTAMLFTVDKNYASMHGAIHVHKKFISSVRIGKKGQIKIPKHSQIARNIANLASSHNDVQISLRDS